MPAAPQPGLVPAAAARPAAISPVTPEPAAPAADALAVPAVAPGVQAPLPAAVVDESAAAPRQAAVDAPPADGRVVSVEELPQSVRAVLGNFAVSGHIWSEDPALRLLTVEDRIVREGGEAAPGVRLEEITQAGAVFTVQGWRFRTGF
jgi:general secretion pathway protein B